MDEIDEILADIDNNNIEKNSSDTNDIDDIINDINDFDDIVSIGVEDDPDESKKQEKSSEVITNTESGPVNLKFSLKGTKTWNTREPYIIPSDGTLLKENISDISKSFFFLDSPVTGDELKSRIKKAMVDYIRRPSDNILSEYSDFVYKHIISLIEEIIKLFNLDSENKNIFIYHTGPFTFYNIIIKKMKNEKIGLCYKYIPENKATRYFPEEFIKEKMLNWFEENINILQLPFDSIQHLEEIKKIVSLKYQSSLKLFNSRLIELNNKIGPDRTISRDRLFRMKSVQWFGIPSIEIYQRFIGRSAFL